MSGDSDVAVLPDGTAVVLSLNLAGSEVCVSHDHGRSFSEASGGSCGQAVPSESGPASDREWLAVGPNGELYQTYTDLLAGLPQVLRSDDHGKTFLPCGRVLDPASPAGQQFVHQGTSLGKPVVGRQGVLVMPFRRFPNTEPRTPLNPDFSGRSIYVAVGPTGGCPPGPALAPFRDSVVFSDAGAAFGNTFDSLAFGPDGALYLATSGRLTASSPERQLYLFRSADLGLTWSKPVRVNRAELRSNVFPVVLAGRRSGQVAIGWYGSEKRSGNSDSGPDWRFYVSESRDGGHSFSTPYRTQVLHRGCLQGHEPTGCSEARLLDFASGATDQRSGRYLFAVPEDQRGPQAGTHALILLQDRG